MAVSNASVAQALPMGKERVQASSEIDMAMFNLRDTLSGITVRDANFSEFLAALKKCGVKAAKPN